MTSQPLAHADFQMELPLGLLWIYYHNASAIFIAYALHRNSNLKWLSRHSY